MLKKIWVYFTIETEADDVEQKVKCSFYIPPSDNQEARYTTAKEIFQDLVLLRDRIRVAEKEPTK